MSANYVLATLFALSALLIVVFIGLFFRGIYRCNAMGSHLEFWQAQYAIVFSMILSFAGIMFGWLAYFFATA